MIKPGQPAPDLDIKLVNGQTWNLKDQKPERFTMIAFLEAFIVPLVNRISANLML